MGGLTTQSLTDFPREGGTVVVLERPAGIRPVHLLDPELPWVVAWRWVRGPRALAAAEPVVPILTGGPGLARLRAVCAVMVLETRRAIELADELTGGVLAQLDGPPGDALPDDFPTLSAYQMAVTARACGVHLTIADEAALVATAFDDAALARLRERYLAVSGERI